VSSAITAALSVFVGAVLAVLAAWGVVTSSTAAPNHNPASSQIVDYGQR
jgi:hypothetical protein